MDDIKVTYVNHTRNTERPIVFVFAKNGIPVFDTLRDGVAWRAFERIGHGSSATVTFPAVTEISVSWNNGTCWTNPVIADNGNRYTVTMDETSIVLTKSGNAESSQAIDIVSNVQIDGGIDVSLYKGGHIIMTKNIADAGEKAAFVVRPKLYWGMASAIEEGERLSSAFIDSDTFFELDLDGLTEVILGLYGNARDGYAFMVDSRQ